MPTVPLDDDSGRWGEESRKNGSLPGRDERDENTCFAPNKLMGRLKRDGIWKTWVLAGLSLLIIGFIFYNSLQGSQESSAMSGRVMALLKPILDPWDRIPEDTFHWLVRKLAHFTEFFVLGLSLCALSGRMIWKSPPMTWYAPAILALLVAMTDEFIQRFTGRTSALKDVAIDLVGALAGIGVTTAVRVLLAKRRARPKS